MKRILNGILDYFSSPEEPRWLRWSPVILLLLVPLYVYAASAHSAKLNTDLYQGDQKVYLRLAQQIHKKGTEVYSPRLRTPGFSYFLAPFWEKKFAPEKSSDVTVAWFERGKRVNIWLSVFLLGGLWFFFRKTIGTGEAFVLTLAAGFLLFVFRSGYVQAELLYWCLNLLAFFLMLRMLVSPGWALAALTGSVSALAFFVKAGTQPLILLFMACFALKVLWDCIRNKNSFTWRIVAQGAIVPAVFLLLLSPYLYGSYKVFGSPFYNANTKYIMWMEENEKDEMYALMRAGVAVEPITEKGFQEKYAELKRAKNEPVTLPRLPTRSRYFEDHTFGEMVARTFRGMKANKKRLKMYYRNAFEILRWLTVIAIVVAVWKWRVVRADPSKGPGPLSTAGKHFPVVVFVSGFFLGYLLLFGWSDGMRIGIRLVLSLYLPAVFVLAWTIRKFSEGLTFTAKGREFQVRKIINFLLMAVVAVKSHEVLTDHLYKYYSGS